MEEGARGLPTGADMFSLPARSGVVLVVLVLVWVFDPASEEGLGLGLGLVGLLAGLAPGEASAAKREAFIAKVRGSR